MEPAKWTEVVQAWMSVVSAGFAGVTAVGLGLVFYQIRMSARTARASFASQLGSEFAERFWGIYRKFLPGGPLSPAVRGDEIGEAEVLEIEQYANFFDTLEVVWRQEMIDLAMIDSLFAYRFFVSINNPHVIRTLRKKQTYWPNLFRLYRDWRAHREGLGLEIPNKQWNLLTDDVEAAAAPRSPSN